MITTAKTTRRPARLRSFLAAAAAGLALGAGTLPLSVAIAHADDNDYTQWEDCDWDGLRRPHRGQGALARIRRHEGRHPGRTVRDLTDREETGRRFGQRERECRCCVQFGREFIGAVQHGEGHCRAQGDREVNGNTEANGDTEVGVDHCVNGEVKGHRDGNAVRIGQ